jgi:hypothetical protein
VIAYPDLLHGGTEVSSHRILVDAEFEGYFGIRGPRCNFGQNPNFKVTQIVAGKTRFLMK